MKLRPKYIKHIEKNIDETKDLLVNRLKNTKNQLRCEVYNSHILVKYKKELHKIWSPQINITFQKEENETIVRGKIGPSGDIWLIFVFFYFFFALLFFGAISFTLIQISLKHAYSASLYVSLFGFMAVLGMYLISYIGQRKSKSQIDYLYKWIESSLNNED